jgi:hypothetical protein
VEDGDDRYRYQWESIIFKSISRNEHAEYSDFAQVPVDVTLAHALELLEKQK